MRRVHFVLAASAMAALILLACWIGLPTEVPAQAKKNPAEGKQGKVPAVKGPALPISQVVLFSSGVGYFQREGEVNGDATMDFSFPVRDVNDLLKSLVLQDLGGGQIRAVGYDSFDPVDKTLKSFALDLTNNPTFAQLLQQARGEKMEVDFQGQTLKGSLVGVEKQRQPLGKDQVIDVDVINLLTAEGLRSLPLSQVQRVRFANAHVDGELKRALEVLAQGHDTHKRTVSLNFSGQGKRPVKMAYVIENPIWKTSYRLVLDKEGKPFLQGWAIVDNVSDEDWKNVQVTLVSGRPISFQMNMYQPLYVDRPWQGLEMFAQLRPQVYGGEMEGKDIKVVPIRGVDPQAVNKMLENMRPSSSQPTFSGGFGRLSSKELSDATVKMPAEALKQLVTDQKITVAKTERDVGKGVTADIAGAEVGQFFQYAIKQSVSLARQRSSMLPIVNEAIEGKRYSVYNAAVQPKHPLLGIKLKNTSTSHLMQGPITVFEGATYAGDARILDLQPKEERLLTFAIDQGVEVEPLNKSEPEDLVSIKIVKGVLHATRKLRQTSSYNVKNRSSQERAVLVEHPFRAEWKLLNEKEPAERSREVYRFLVDVPAGKSKTQQVVEELSRVDEIALTNADDQSIRLFLTHRVASAKIKEALEKALGYRVKLAETQREIAQIEKQIKAVAEDQTRIRANMERVPQNSAPYQRYVKKLDEQETQIEGFQETIKTLRRREEEQRREYEVFLVQLTLND